MATYDTITYHGLAVSEEDWKAMEEKNETIIGPIDIDFMRRHR